MRFTIEDSSAEKFLNVTFDTMNIHTHLLDLMNILKWTPESFLYFQKVMIDVKNKMSSPESSLVLNTLFDKRFFKTAAVTPKPLDEAFLGTVLWRKNETYFDFVSYPRLLKDYKRNEIKQCLGLNFNEYISLTPYEKMEVDKFSVEWSQEMAKMMQQQQSESDDRLNDYKKSMARATKQPIGGGLDVLNPMGDE